MKKIIIMIISLTIFIVGILIIILIPKSSESKYLCLMQIDTDESKIINDYKFNVKNNKITLEERIVTYQFSRKESYDERVTFIKQIQEYEKKMNQKEADYILDEDNLTIKYIYNSLMNEDKINYKKSNWLEKYMSTLSDFYCQKEN